MGRFEPVRANIRRAYEAGRATVRAAKANEEQHEPAAAEGLTQPAELPPPPPPHQSTSSQDDSEVPYALRIGAAWAWRMIVIGIVLLALLWLMGRLTIVVVPVAIALLLGALLAPAVGWLRRARLHRSLAALLVVIGGLAAVVGTLTLVINEFVNGLPDLVANATDGIGKIQTWLKEGPLQLKDTQLEDLNKQINELVNDNQDKLTTGALTTATTALEVVSGMFLVLFTLFFFLRDGQKIWRFLLRIVPARTRERVDHAGLAAWRSLGSYVRATVLVAFIDAVGIGIALAVLDVPFVFPLAALVFLGAFIPIIGATISGAVAVLVALVTNGPISALLVLAAVIAVQQIEGHLLQPLIMGRAVSIHPLAVILGIAAGLVLAGIIGALIAVPIIAVLNTAIRHLSSHRRMALADPQPSGAGTPSG